MKVVAWLEKQVPDSQFVSVITIGELRRGATLLTPGTRRVELERFIDLTVPAWFEDRVLPVTRSAGVCWMLRDSLLDVH